MRLPNDPLVGAGHFRVISVSALIEAGPVFLLASPPVAFVAAPI